MCVQATKYRCNIDSKHKENKLSDGRIVNNRASIYQVLNINNFVTAG